MSVESKAAKTGLHYDYAFATPAGDPADQIKWALFTAQIKDAKGGVVFEQRDVSFPEFYSQLAVNVVASKYFYGDVTKGNGDPDEGKREHSLGQLVDRVSGTIAHWGWLGGYFASAESSVAFEKDLKYLLLHQYGSFNSPVWFNLGLWNYYSVRGDYDGFYWSADTQKPEPVPAGDAYKYPQGSACFILGVEDSITSIYERAKTEGRIFKYGSGAGANNSKLRSRRETVRGGGKPSGPLSFMSVYDAVAKVTKSGGINRRAAKMEILNAEHPDIAEFIGVKEKEEAKAHALIAQGYEADYNGEAYSTVCYQNCNMSVRVSDSFMLKASGDDPDPSWQTIAVTTGTAFNGRGEQMPVYDARQLLRKVAEGTWRCGDPGLQFDDTINEWNPVASTHRQNGTNPCSEFSYIDDSACNLASLNLLKFLRDDNTFDTGRFAAAVRTFIIAQDILVDRAGYPTEAICRNSHEHRPLGLGYTNLGALLMTLGLPYDSIDARSMAGAITALMHGAANLASTELAGVLGPFAAYEENRATMRRVMEQHASHLQSPHSSTPRYIREVWDYARTRWNLVQLDGANKGFRNGQVTLLAPTGTIAFMMDAATTGIEPDIALVKYKNLAGGGMLKIVNTAVPRALKNLGYDQTAIDQIVAYIEEHGTVEGCYKHLDTEHLPVFDCAFPAKPGGRSIAWQGHVRMMAAVQPFLSGAISKTINMPADSTVEDIEQAYILGWRKGLKAMAIYRDGSKGSQPVSTKKTEEKTDGVPVSPADHLPAADVRGPGLGDPGGAADPDLPAAAGWVTIDGAPFVPPVKSPVIQKPTSSHPGVRAGDTNTHIAGTAHPTTVELISPEVKLVGPNIADTVQAFSELEREAAATGRTVADVAKARLATPPPVVADEHRCSPCRERLPETRTSLTHKFDIQGHEGYVTVGLYPDGRPGELFIKMAKEGSTIGGLMDVLGTSISIGLQYGVPLEVLVNKFEHQRFEPSGMTKHRDIPFAKSIVDYIFRWLGMQFIPGYREANAPQREPEPEPVPVSDKVEPTVTLAAVYATPPVFPGDTGDPKPVVDKMNDAIREMRALERAARRDPRTSILTLAPIDGGSAPIKKYVAPRKPQGDAPACDNCGSLTIRCGTCYRCPNCGTSLGCS
jgi:ribonucleoside-diphosphate reductase alpha chain